jgi:exportin-T
VLDRKSLQAVLSALFKKMRYDDDEHSQENDDSDIEAEFHDLRKRLLGFQDSIAVLDPALYSESVYQFVTNTFKAMNSASNTDWRDAEVALLELHSFAEPLKGTLWVGFVH